MTTHSNDWNGILEPLDFQYVALIVGFRHGANFSIGQISLGATVAAELRGVAEEVAEALSQMEHRAWSAESSWERDELRVIQFRQLDEDNPVIEALSAREYDDLTLSDLRVRQLIFYAIVVGSQPGDGAMDERRIFLRKTNPRMGADRKVVTLLSGDELTRITEPLFTFDRKVDLVFAPGRGLLAVNEGPFDILFRDTPELMAKTPAYARTVASLLPLSSGSEDVLVGAAVRYARVRRRVLAAVGRGHLANVTMTQLRTELRRQGLDPTKHVSQGKLVITEENVLDIVRVLNEDLLTGGLSGQRFEIERKSAL